MFLTLKRARGEKRETAGCPDLGSTFSQISLRLLSSSIITGGKVFTHSDRALSHTPQEAFQPIGLSERTFLLDLVSIPGVTLKDGGPNPSWTAMGSCAPLLESYHSEDLL